MIASVISRSTCCCHLPAQKAHEYSERPVPGVASVRGLRRLCPSALEVADIFVYHLCSLAQRQWPGTSASRWVMSAIERLPHGGARLPMRSLRWRTHTGLPNSWRNRPCPKCQGACRQGMARRPREARTAAARRLLPPSSFIPFRVHLRYCLHITIRDLPVCCLRRAAAQATNWRISARPRNRLIYFKSVSFLYTYLLLVMYL